MTIDALFFHKLHPPEYVLCQALMGTLAKERWLAPPSTDPSLGAAHRWPHTLGIAKGATVRWHHRRTRVAKQPCCIAAIGHSTREAQLPFSLATD